MVHANVIHFFMSICQPAGVDELTRIKLAKQQEKGQRFFPRCHLRLSDSFIRSGLRALGVSPGGPDGGAEAYRPIAHTQKKCIIEVRRLTSCKKQSI